MLELLAPAGDMEKLKIAFKFGADACYFAGKRWGLRAFSNNFEADEMEECVNYAHSIGKKCYITVNVIAHNKDFEGLKEYLQYLEKIGVDAVIVADVGIASFVKKYTNLQLHISTQANITNVYSAKFFEDFGANRLILARELSLKEIEEIRNVLRPETELETFVHGAMCISYSGRCLLSNYFAGRDSNAGACVQACRWEYAIAEKNQQGQYYPIEEDKRGTYILNSKDLCMIKHLPELAKAGVSSFKIEGRMKSQYYVATIVNAYRRVLDALEIGEEVTAELYDEVFKASHRNYTTGFYYPNENKENLETSLPVQTSEFMGIVTEDSDGEYTMVEQRNKFSVGDELEILSNDDNFNKKFTITEIIDSKGELVESAKNVQEIVRIKCPYKLSKLDILRKDTKN